MLIMKFVIAGNYRQFTNYCRENRLQPNKDVRYVGRPEDTRGVRNVEIIKYGTWWENPAANDILELERAGYFTSVTEK